jgi:hypothetical protein
MPFRELTGWISIAERRKRDALVANARARQKAAGGGPDG